MSIQYLTHFYGAYGLICNIEKSIRERENWKAKIKLKMTRSTNRFILFYDI